MWLGRNFLLKGTDWRIGKQNPSICRFYEAHLHLQDKTWLRVKGCRPEKLGQAGFHCLGEASSEFNLLKSPGMRTLCLKCLWAFMESTVATSPRLPVLPDGPAAGPFSQSQNSVQRFCSHFISPLQILEFLNCTWSHDISNANADKQSHTPTWMCCKVESNQSCTHRLTLE